MQGSTTSQVTRDQRVGDNRRIAEWCGWRSKKGGANYFVLMAPGSNEVVDSAWADELLWRSAYVPDFFADPAAFVELLRVCAARCIYISLEWLPRGVWRCILELKDNPKSVHSEASTECEALALCVLDLITKEGGQQ